VGGDLRVRYWPGYGKPRLYLKNADGLQIGYFELGTGKSVMEVSGYEAAFDLAVKNWLASNPQPQESEITPSPTPPPPAVRSPEASRPIAATEAPWTDLAWNGPGGGLKVKAAELWLEAPVSNTIKRVLGRNSEERGWRVGAAGEQKVHEELAKLHGQDPWWTFINSIPAGSQGRDIDHLVIGPGGVFSLNTKCHPKKVVKVSGSTMYVNGSKVDHLWKSRKEAEHASTTLTRACGVQVGVTGLVVIVDAAKLVPNPFPPGCGATNRARLVDYLRQMGRVLDGETIHRVFEAARRSTTWDGDHSSPHRKASRSGTGRTGAAGAT